MFKGIGHASVNLGIRGVREVGGIHLPAKKLLVDETVQNGAAIVVSELCEGSVGKQRFVTESFVPVALQDDVAVDGGDDAVDHLGGSARWCQQKYRKQECQRYRSNRSVDSKSH